MDALDVWTPDRQRVVIVGATAWPQGTAERAEAAEVVIELPWARVPPDKLVRAVRDAIGKAPHKLEDRRASSSWGAAGLSTQDVVITFLLNYSSDIASALTVAGIFAVLNKLKHHAANTTTAFTTLSADQAWIRTEQHVRDAFAIRKTEAVGITKTGEGWRIEARDDQWRVFVIVGPDGSIERSWRQDN